VLAFNFSDKLVIHYLKLVSMKKRLYVLFICMSIIWPQANAEQQTVILGASLFPPSAYIDKSTGKCVGENIDVTSKILAHYNIKLEVVCTLPARMYLLVKNSEVDFTVNVKSTRALSPYVEYVAPPLKKLVINLYRYGTNSEFKTISAIRGFDYNGSRQKFVDRNYQFVDLPTAESALQLFLKRRSDALISYQSNVTHLKQQNAITFPKEITVTPLLEVNAYYGITKGSANFDLLRHVLKDYAEQHNLEYFVPQKTD
tara:strand:+ start:262 stop:1032 length:771 start_codon:yes stop_codon:yes gene_type:complete